MKEVKSIFDKSYIVKAQAEKAGLKEWPQGTDVAELTFDEATKKYRWVKAGILAKWDKAHNAASALEAGQRLFKAFTDVAAYKLKAAEAPQNAHICPECGSDELFVGHAPEGLVIDEEFCGGCHQCDWAYDLRIDLKVADAMANATMEPVSPRPRLSTCLGPTKRVWHIADSMPKASRKDVMAECIRQGVAYGTARTQYQAWFKASQEGGDGSARKPYEKA